MMTMSSALSTGQATNYYQKEFTSAKENYYSESGEVRGRWSGRLAEEWELKGEVQSEQYERLVAGQDPHTGEQLIRSVKSRETVNEFGEEIVTSEHRAGWDATISAPKSVSLAALVGDDERIRVAHRESVGEALKSFEEYLQARGGGDKPANTTGKMVAAQFEHTASRPDRATGYAAPQLHTHVVIFNVTQTEEGKARSVQPLELYRSQRYATAIYRMHLAEKLQGLGYEIEVDPRTGAPEIKGFSKQYLQESSPRREEVVKGAEAMKERLEREGGVVSENARLKQAAARTDRRSKHCNHAEMRERALEMDLRHDYQAQHTVDQAQERGPIRLSQEEIAMRAQEAQRMLEMERSNLEKVIDGQGIHQPIIGFERARPMVNGIAEQQHIKLNENQRAAVEEILTSRDQIMGLQGGAGTGKTTALSVLREAAEKAGYEVRGFAPTTRAAQQLAESGIQTETLQKFIRRRQEAPETSNRLLVLDESSLASTKNLHKFFARLEPKDKVLLVGDSRQHQAVEAGTPFEQFQKHGMATVKLSEIVRQRDPELKRTVERLSAREMSQALDSLQSRGRVIEMADEKNRSKAIAKAYCESPENTLVISPANRERVKLNALIHQRLQREGKVSRDDHQMTVYVNRHDMTGTERTFANSYLPGEDIIRYNRASKVYQVEVGDYGRVTAANHEKNEITVSLKDGREITYNPSRLSGVSVYKEAQRDVAEGDRIQFRAPFTEKRVANGELGTIARIRDEELTVKLDSGREVSFETERYRHIDHGYAVTSHSSQGQTVDRVLINADTRESELLLNDRMGYVAVSRAREEAIIFTNSLHELREALDRRVDKDMALDATRYGQNQTHLLREESTRDASLHHEQSGSERSSDQAITNDNAQLNATNDMAQTEEMEFDLA